MSVGVLKGWNVFGLELLTLCTMISWFTLFGLKLHIKPLQTRSPCNRSEQTYCKCVCVFVCVYLWKNAPPSAPPYTLHPILVAVCTQLSSTHHQTPWVGFRRSIFRYKKKMMRGLPSSQPLVTGTLAVTYCNIILPS